MKYVIFSVNNITTNKAIYNLLKLTMRQMKTITNNQTFL